MKKQFLITKIRKHLLYAMLVAVFFCSCNEQQNPVDVKEIQLKQAYRLIDEYCLQAIEKDSCEYLYAYTGRQSGFMFTHKGNCKYCTERAKKHCH